MTAKDKAKELLDKYVIILYNSTPFTFDIRRCKQCAVVAVNEIINSTEGLDYLPNYSNGLLFRIFWDEVKQEIEKL